MSQPASTIASAPGPTDYEVARLCMVDTQIRPVQVSDSRILEAMRRLPRERFVGPERAAIAYMDQDVPLSGGRVLTEPRVVARLVQSLVPRRGERALVIGAGTGYAACLLDALLVEVVALEQDETLAAHGQVLLSDLAPRVDYRIGSLAAGCPEAGPFDMILIDGAVRAIPETLAAQLTPAGRIAGVLAVPGKVSTAFLAESSPVGLRPRAQFDCATPLLGELAPAPTFRF